MIIICNTVQPALKDSRKSCFQNESGQFADLLTTAELMKADGIMQEDAGCKAYYFSNALKNSWKAAQINLWFCGEYKVMYT